MMEIAKLFNQYSILDWKAVYDGEKKIEIPNPSFNEKSPKLDKDAILRKIRKEK